MVWQRQATLTYLESVTETLNALYEWSLQPDPRMALLGIMDDIVASRHQKLFLYYAFFYACREIRLQ